MKIVLLPLKHIGLMSRMQKNRDKMKGSVMKICPKIIKILEQNKAHTGDLIAYKANDDNYQVEDISGFFKTYKVNLNQRCCSCRRWDLNGIPCSHAIAAIRTKGEVPEDYVHHCYTVEAYMRSYKPAIMPIHPSDLWTKTGQKPPLPPKYKVQPGRPKKLRKRDPIENESIVGDKLISKLSRKGEKKKCSICGQYGHNKRSCKNQLLKLNHLLLKLLMFKSSPLVLLHGLFHHRQLESHQEKEN
ncbi:PREDICTED: uncharacterized protein LOC109168128 [Ipomoea nil]|uniref:uncharacterized protein LOC109168128 n=1 Tax=Ipomoea nil TaxID=35883 RepID=UPI000901B138|nr:PREDICTED: uncharacterized protein LOC109168128 [Ipomoea nil]